MVASEVGDPSEGAVHTPLGCGLVATRQGRLGAGIEAGEQARLMPLRVDPLGGVSQRVERVSQPGDLGVDSPDRSAAR